ncbi:multidrug efflux pump subunit AcrA (membrane-fusion protein) [Nonomuraea polychroma]|uniref:Multidrug efflux pump subunit AcrA (Membrane-fusion protein) n=1 Tax=Nonomuraea polychroma TaxID=46176 RepID=A0A438MAD1_9ACTN|nr:peptidoglycan-binding protein [Nonomuraea polychroma]RVX42673.1 multidrug efflux pump subunit AcrA (membrane-fusion protein) [Nonomuraea polychroma]
MSRRGIVGAAALVLLLAAGAAAAALITRSGGAAAGEQTATLPPATAAVERGDLIDTLTVSGTLGHGPEQPVVNAAGGTLTELPEEGEVISRGEELYEVNRDPVLLMYGPKPMHRTLELGVPDGADVRHLEKNLSELGYKVEVDDHFGLSTLAAVRKWQDKAGLPVTGSVSKAEVVVLPGEVRVQALRAPVGTSVHAGQTLLTVTGVERLVTVQLDAGRQSLARKGAPVQVELPGELELKGKISEVGTVAKQADGDTTVDVRIRLDDPGKAGKLDQVPVSVELQSEIRRDVLSVPVEALLALRQSGYGVEVVEGSNVRVVPVTAGIFANGRVEVSGGGLTEGMRVGVPAT